MKELIVLCGIVELEGLVLITQRSQTMSQPLLWEFPGGKLEPGEDEKACLVRELQEELEITVLPQQRLQPSRYTYPDIAIVLVPYVCSFVSGTINLLEHSAYEWVKPEHLLSYNWCPADVPIVQDYLQHRKG